MSAAKFFRDVTPLERAPPRGGLVKGRAGQSRGWLRQDCKRWWQRYALVHHVEPGADAAQHQIESYSCDSLNQSSQPDGMWTRGLTSNAESTVVQRGGGATATAELAQSGPTTVEWPTRWTDLGDGHAVGVGLRAPDGAIGRAASKAISRGASRSWTSWVWSAVNREAQMAWNVLKSDLPSGTFPGWFFTGAAFLHVGAADAAVLAGSLVYFTLSLYQFCIANQAAGVAEDQINKRFRPMASGAMTVRGGWVRYGVATLAFPALAYALGVLPYALVWQASSAAYNLLGASRHFVCRSFVMVAGVFAQQAAAWGMVTSISPIVWQWICTVTAASFVFFNVQDLRDAHGDSAVGRRTLPLIFSLAPSCRALALVVGIGGPAVLRWMAGSLRACVSTLGWQAVASTLCWLAAGKMWLDATPEGLHEAYEIFIVFYGMLLLGAFLLPSAGALA